MRRTLLIVITACSVLLTSHAVFAQKPYRGAEYRTLATSTYGRFEVRMKSAPVSGMLASFFTYYDTANPWNEIDIEIMGRYVNELQFNVINPTQADNHVQRQTLKFNPHLAFHVYAVDWTPAYVSWSADGVELYRQTGSHVSTLSYAQKLMMNIWQPASVDWAGSFNPAALPIFAYYDWVKYYTYTPGVNDDFTLQWTDNFDYFNALRWAKATHTWDGNNCQFVQENVAFQDGYMILCMTGSTSSGYGGAAIADTDVDPPWIVAARAYDATILVQFSEELDRTTAETAGNYLAGGNVTVQSASLRPDKKSVLLGASGMDLASPFILFVSNVKDVATPAHAMPLSTFRVIMPQPFPIRINVGGAVATGYLADSTWNASKEWGGVGGTPYARSAGLAIGGTAEPEIFRTGVNGLASYNIRVPDGAYNVTLLMAETEYTAPNQRVFSARVEGQPVFTGLDLCQQVGANVACERTLTNLPVTDGILSLQFSASVGVPTLSGLRIERLTTGVKTEGDLPRDFRLDAYPNPFNSTTTILYSTPTNDEARFGVFDLLGREILQMTLAGTTGKVSRISWNATGVASGTYICSLSQAHLRMSRVIMFLK
jgi:hypothetical protein